jgi:ABC-type transport system involved in multi-copper enzyme maturation permease subunit
MAEAELLAGYPVLLDKELHEAGRSKRIVAFFIITTFALVLIPLIGYGRVEYFGDGFRHEVSSRNMDALVGTWATLVGFLGSLMVIASTVDAVSHERSLGIIAWVVTKPVSRLSYLFAKASAHAMMACAAIVILPSAVWCLLMVALFREVPVANIIVAAGILCIEMTFLSFVIVALGVPLRSVTPIAIIALALWFLPNVVPEFERLRWTANVLPSYLPIAAVGVAIDEAGSYTLTIPLASVAVAAVAFVGAVLAFERQEL